MRPREGAEAGQKAPEVEVAGAAGVASFATSWMLVLQCLLLHLRSFQMPLLQLGTVMAQAPGQLTRSGSVIRSAGLWFREVPLAEAGWGPWAIAARSLPVGRSPWLTGIQLTSAAAFSIAA